MRVLKTGYKGRIGAGLASLLNVLVLVCPGDGGRPPAVPPPPVPHLAPLLACPRGPAITDTDVEGGTAGGRGRARGRGDAPGLTPVEGAGLHRGGDVTGHGLGPGPATEAGPETGTETGDDTHHTGEQGFTLQPLLGGVFFFSLFRLFFFFHWQIAFQLTTGDTAKGSKQWKPQTRRQRQPQPQPPTVPESC